MSMHEPRTLQDPQQLRVVVLSYNHAQLTQRCLQSALRFFVPTQVHVIHNGSDAKVVRELQDLFATIHHHVLDENRGFAGGANWGLKHAFQDSEWALFLSNDCELLTFNEIGWPEQPGLYAPLVWRRHSGVIDSYGAEFSPSGARLRHCRESNEHIPAGSKARREFFYVPGSTFLLHREVFFAAQGFDQRLHTYLEDVDFSLRISKMGWALGKTSFYQARHGVGKTCHSQPYYTSYLFHRNRFHLGRIYGSLFSEWRLLGETVQRTVRSVWRGRWRQARYMLRAYADSWLL